MARRTRIYFATDLHGSSKCFRKFLNAGPTYGADVLVLGADLAGKAIQAIVRAPGRRWRCRFIGTDHDVADGPELEALEKLIEDHGYYPYRAEPGELEGRQADRTLEAPMLDAELTVQQSLGQVKFAPVGSSAVRAAIEAAQPLLGLHGQIHESVGIRRIGRTIAINPGSDYGTGALNGTLVTLERDKVATHQLVRG
jgi:Icc-related predicted phosphoesterase